ncbi:MAG: glycosyltransferase family 4 protein [Chthoniobacterales bacterium]
MKLGFVYAGGRVDRLEELKKNPKSIPSDFFYGALELERNGDEVLYDEVDELSVSRLLRWLDHNWGLWFPVRFSLAHFVACLPHLEKWNGCDCIVATNSRAGMSLGLLKKLGRLRTPIVTIHCGIVNCTHTPWRRRLTAPLMKVQEVFLFAETERQPMAEAFSIPDDRFHVCDFGVDTDYWGNSEAEGDFVFAAGNDGRRDFETFVKAASASSYPHKLLTKLSVKTPFPANLDHVRSGWKDASVSDGDLRDLYQNSRCVVVPLLDTWQPSGQSVALQAMSCGRPVILTKTKGFWLHPEFEEGNHVLFFEPGNEKQLAEKVRFLMENPTEARRIGKNGREVMLKHYSIQNFADHIKSACQFAIKRNANL